MACFAARTASGARLPVPFRLVTWIKGVSAGLGIIKLARWYHSGYSGGPFYPGFVCLRSILVLHRCLVLSCLILVFNLR
jgi:hypothetical protein